ncbi:S1 family peptidase [Streptosporangium sp. DT93]|uniref:S1 family peptidase n=1 Tax=Streptosporangium sp. DT93 TaxID=3393428 RepID=UPI003CFA9DBB
MSAGHAVSRGCVVAVTAVALAAVPAGAARRADRPATTATTTATTTAATAATTTVARMTRVTTATVAQPDPSPAMLRAMQRDLGLTPEQARTRLLNEARLSPVAAQLRIRLGTRFAGAWLRGPSALRLVVATTSAADTPMILAAGAHAEIVPRSLSELAAIKSMLDRALPVKRLVSSVRYVDAKRNRVVLLAQRTDETQNVIEAVGVDNAAVVVLPSTEVPEPLHAPAVQDVLGGNAFHVGLTSRCSVGFAVFTGTRSGFVTAGHCGRTGTRTTGFNGTVQGVFRGSLFPGGDHSWVQVDRGWRTAPEVDDGEGGTVPVAGARIALEGASVCRSDAAGGLHCGLIQQRDASVTYPQGNVFGLTRTSVCAEAGDSGGPFISFDQAQGIASGGSGDCGQGGTSYFEPIDEVLNAYDLTLKTVADTRHRPPASPVPPP